MVKPFSCLKKKTPWGGTWLNLVLIALIVIVLGLAAAYSYRAGGKTLNEEKASAKAESFINEFLMQSGTKATVKEISSEYGLYKLKIDIVSDVVDSYISKDGKLFFPQALDIEKISGERKKLDEGNNDNGGAAAIDNNIPKSAKPKVELFVMTHCPYGTQMEKGIMPAIEALGNKVDFDIKWNSYAMHGEKELKETMVQYCIKTQEPSKFSPYLKCFLEAGDTAGCLDKSGINTAKNNSCVAQTDAKFKISDNFKNKVGYQGSFPGIDIYKADNEKYNVGGSPTLVINGKEVSSARDSASLLKTICGAFEEAPKECQAQLSSSNPSAGFGYGTAASGSAADCGQ